ncbi:MAG: glycosyltransferase family 2 protein [Chloroflexi bacterium]|jgi:glycosyltransferase involved in cell wall biosynthesis|nr:glycosyltransferase family 2 protein [Chloroflexota bacterium]
MLSVLVPVYNGGHDLERCLAAIADGTRQPEELIVIDDASTDGSGALAKQLGARVVTLSGEPKGPANARNRGAMVASGDIIVFVDADVAAHSDTLARLEQRMLTDDSLAGVFGSYDDAPTAPNLVSQYKNLQHHWVHQHGRRHANTFWAGCGAIRRDAFLAVGGYNPAYGRPAIEDIELGLRLTEHGLRIELDRDIQCTHLKRWSLLTLLRADILGRAVPWCREIARRGHAPHDLNLNDTARWSGVLSWAMLLSLGASFWLTRLALVAFGCFTILVLLNRSFYRFLWQQGGWRLGLAGVVLHLCYYLYSSAVFACVAAPGLAWRRLRATKRAQPS